MKFLTVLSLCFLVFQDVGLAHDCIEHVFCRNMLADEPIKIRVNFYVAECKDQISKGELIVTLQSDNLLDITRYRGASILPTSGDGLFLDYKDGELEILASESRQKTGYLFHISSSAAIETKLICFIK